MNRRSFLSGLGMSSAFFTVRGAFAEALVQTPAQTEGPYYPDRLPLDMDNDLLIINDAITPAVGQIAWVSGRVLDASGSPMRGAVVEIWQADDRGAYIHSKSPIANRDVNFQGYGKFETASSGEYLFRTVKPGLYPGRTRHVHMIVNVPGRSKLTTQLYVEGEPQNSSDGVLNGIRDAAARSSVVVPWTAIESSRIGELAARFDIVMGLTPEDAPAGPKPTLAKRSAVVNAAAFQQGIAPGAWTSIFGDNLAATTRTWNAADIVDGKLPASLDGVSVTIDNKPAAIQFISPKQINVQAPSDEPAGPVQVQVTTADGTSDPVTATMQPLLPGFFRFAQDYVKAMRADGVSIDSTTVPAKPGDAVALFGTGFGPTDPGVPAGEAFQGRAILSNAVAIRIGTVVADVSFAGLTSAGIYQFDLTIPDLPDGDYPVTAAVGGVRTQSVARLRIQR
jgi:protocatechuate 3,4-dioxygenase, beta subunit